MTYFLYDIAASVAAPFGAMYLACSAKYRPLLARFHPSVPMMDDRPVWVQACSMGEVGVAKPLIGGLCARHPDAKVLLTASTLTGRAQAESSCFGVPVTWFPFDHRIVAERFVREARPRALVLVETELWPGVLRAARHERVPVIVVNGRLSDKHLPRYERLRPLLRPVLDCITVAGMQNDEYAARIVRLGLDPSRVRVTGNVKFDGVATEAPAEACNRLRNEIALSVDTRVLVFGSTRPGDEALAGRAWQALRGEFPDLRLVIAPRHTERTDEAARALGCPSQLLSEVRGGARVSVDRPLLVDSMGELIAFYGLATVAVVGGSFFPGVEGHNPLEPAALGVATVFGPYMRNFGDPARVLVRAGGACQVPSEETLLPALRDLLRDQAARGRMGAAGRAAILGNRGAIDRNLDLLDEILWRTPEGG